MTVRRRASVGCAVNTRRIDAIEQRSCNPSAVLPWSANGRSLRRSIRVSAMDNCSASRLRMRLNALVVLGKIDQLKVVGEGADQDIRFSKRNAGNERLQLVARGRITCPERFAKCADVLFEVKGGLTSLGTNNLAEQITEQIDVVR